MKVLSAQNGNAYLRNSEMPVLGEKHLLVKTVYSAVSPGTELSMIKNSVESFDLGYSASGVIVEVGEKVTKFEVGESVAVYGAPYVGHREFLSVPETLAAKVPENVDMKDAALAGIGAIAIHGLRQANLQFGEIVIVVGLGIYGQLISQIALSSGYDVIALNRSRPRVDLLQSVSNIAAFDSEEEMGRYLDMISDGHGADAVLLCAGGKKSELTNKSFRWLRDRGTSVIVGDIEPHYDRGLMFSKELNIKISRAGGPGRYDSVYENEAVDYPYGYVRWTEGRNVREFLRLLSNKRIDVAKYYNQVMPLEKYEKAYDELSQSGARYLTHLFKYEED